VQADLAATKCCSVAFQSSSEKGSPKASALDEILTVGAFFRFNNLPFSDTLTYHKARSLYTKIRNTTMIAL